MPRKPKGLNKPIAKTAARMSRKAALTPAQKNILHHCQCQDLVACRCKRKVEGIGGRRKQASTNTS